MEKEKTYGSVHVNMGGTFHSIYAGKPRAWDIVELLPTTNDPVAAVVPTRIKITREQSEGKCPLPLLPCKSAKDCEKNEHPWVLSEKDCKPTTSEKMSGCVAHQWCPAQDLLDSTRTEIHDFIGVSRMKMYFYTGITFSSLDDQKKFQFPENPDL